MYLRYAVIVFNTFNHFRKGSGTKKFVMKFKNSSKYSPKKSSKKKFIKKIRQKNMSKNCVHTIGIQKVTKKKQKHTKRTIQKEPKQKTQKS